MKKCFFLVLVFTILSLSSISVFAEEGDPIYETHPAVYEDQPIYETHPAVYEDQPIYETHPAVYEDQPIYETHAAVYEDQPIYHEHTGSSTTGGGCYTKKVAELTWQTWPNYCANCGQGPLAHYEGNPYGACSNFVAWSGNVVTGYHYELACGMTEKTIIGYNSVLITPEETIITGYNSVLVTAEETVVCGYNNVLVAEAYDEIIGYESICIQEAYDEIVGYEPADLSKDEENNAADFSKDEENNAADFSKDEENKAVDLNKDEESIVIDLSKDEENKAIVDEIAVINNVDVDSKLTPKDDDNESANVQIITDKTPLGMVVINFEKFIASKYLGFYLVGIIIVMIIVFTIFINNRRYKLEFFNKQIKCKLY